MLNIIKQYWNALRWLVLLGAAIIFSAGILYNYRISSLNSEHLRELDQRAYPFIEKTNSLELKFEQVQESFSAAVLMGDATKTAAAMSEGKAFATLLAELEPLVDDRQAIVELGILFEKYIKLAEEIRGSLLERDADLGQIQPVIQAFDLSRQAVAEKLKSLNEQSRASLMTAVQQLRDNSKRTLSIGLWSSIAAMALISIVAAIIFSLNRKLTLVNERLEEQVKSRTNELESFVYTASHDLKAPVISIQGMASILLQDHGHQLNNRGRFYVERIIQNASFMEDLIIGLLALSRVGRAQGKAETAEVRDVIQEVLKINHEWLDPKKIEVVVQPDLPGFSYNKVQLMQIFQNLMTNAAKFMGDQPHPCIEIGGRQIKNEVEFYVKDNGIGIDSEYHEKIFDMFQRLKEVEVEGTGVGLSIVKKIVDLAQGKIWIESKKGKGATFFIRLPRASEA